MRPVHGVGAVRTIRCAVYTRKSTEEGLQQEFNSLDAQREAGEAYIASQKAEGWVCLPDRYDDGGYTGGNLDRPALQRLLADIEAGKIDCVVVYKVDRLSRSLMDFARIVQVFDGRQVWFVSVTQQFNTTTSMGRLTLNILLSFAQFEREIISERTRDKIAAARRRGKWSGGQPVLGYDLISSPAGSRLVVNEDEAGRVRAIFELYLQHEALIPTVAELDRRGWTTKRWQSKAGRIKGGRRFDKMSVFKLLTNVVYTGQVRYREEIHPGEQPAIVDQRLWQRVQAVLGRNGRTGGALVRNRYGALLKGILWCGPCQCSMGHTYSSRGSKRYRYYVCLNAQKRGWHNCPTKSVPAGQMEEFVVQQIQRVGRDTAVLAETLSQARAQRQQALAQLQAEDRAIVRERVRLDAELRRLAGDADSKADRLADVQERLRQAEDRQRVIREQMATWSGQTLDEREVQAALASFTPVWEALSPREQARIIRLLVARVDYDGAAGTVAVTFRPHGIKAALAEEAAA